MLSKSESSSLCWTTGPRAQDHSKKKLHPENRDFWPYMPLRRILTRPPYILCTHQITNWCQNHLIYWRNHFMKRNYLWTVSWKILKANWGSFSIEQNIFRSHLGSYCTILQFFVQLFFRNSLNFVFSPQIAFK